MMPEGEMYHRAFGLALDTDHAAMALRDGAVRKYPADVAPFAAMEEISEESLGRLHGLMQPGESVWLVSGEAAVPHVPGLSKEEELVCLQMAFPAGALLPARLASIELLPMDCGDRAAMVALTELAFPGFFREWTCRMGRYFGVWEGEILVAMGGERINFTVEGSRYREISGLCTHPEHRGKGYASELLTHLLALHRSEGSASWLHVSAKNPAKELYKKIGFVTANVVELRKVRRGSS